MSESLIRTLSTSSVYELQDRLLEFHKTVSKEITELESLAEAVDGWKRATDELAYDTKGRSVLTHWQATYDEVLRIAESLGAASSAIARRRS